MTAVKMHAGEIHTGISLVSRLLSAQFPQWADLSITLVPSAGTDNALYRLGNDMVVRLPLSTRDSRTRAAIASCVGLLDTGAVTAAWLSALQAPVWRGAPVWLHGDLKADNLLVQQGRSAPSSTLVVRAMNLIIRPLTPEQWPALEDLFGEHGAINGCWCMYWRIGSAYRKRPRDENKAAFRELVKSGLPPGLLAFDGNIAVGWCQLTPRDALPWLDRTWRLKRVDDVPVWSLSCLSVRKGHRKQGITSALIAAAVDVAKRAGAPALEAYPLDASLTPSASGTGYASTFERAGFKIVARHVPPRPIMRHDLQSVELGASIPSNPHQEGQISDCTSYRWEKVDGHTNLMVIDERPSE